MHDADLATRVAALGEIWCAVLDIERVEETDNFFELGGDSMLALEAAERARGAGMAMPVSAVLRRPVLVELAEAVLDPEKFSLSPDASGQPN